MRPAPGRAGARQGVARRLARVGDPRSSLPSGGHRVTATDRRSQACSGYLRHRSFLAEAMRPRADLCGTRSSGSLRPGMTVIDGGAQAGLYTLLAARGVGLDGLVRRVRAGSVQRSPRSTSTCARSPSREHPCDAEGAVECVPATATFYEPTEHRSAVLSSSGRDSRRATAVETAEHRRRASTGRAITELLVKLNARGSRAARARRGDARDCSPRIPARDAVASR